MRPLVPEPRIRVGFDEARRIVVASPALSALTHEQAEHVLGAVRRAAESALTGRPLPCPTCQEREVTLRETRYMLAATTWSLVDAVMWGGRVLDAHTAAPEEIAEELLDRIGEVLSHLTGKRIAVSADRAVVLTDPGVPEVYGKTAAEACGLATDQDIAGGVP